MRALRFCGLSLAVAVAHLAAWQAVAARWSDFGAPRGRSGGATGRVAWVAVDRRPAGEHPSGAAAAPPAATAPGPVPDEPDPPTRPDQPSGRRAPLASPTRPLRFGSTPAAMAPESGRQPPPADRPASGAGHAPAEFARWPVYATRPPPSIRLDYRLEQTNPRGDAPSGHATLAWTRDAAAFSLCLSTALAGRAPREWRSDGAFDAAGLAPDRLVQRDRGRQTRAIAFDRGASRVRFAGSAPALPAAPGAQDRWSWIGQLAAIAEADPRQLGVVHLQVAGLRGDVRRWTFRTLRQAAPPAGLAPGLAATLQAAPLLHLLREPEHPYDLRVEAWLAPALHHLPVALRLTAPPGKWSFTLRLETGAPGRPAEAVGPAATQAPGSPLDFHPAAATCESTPEEPS